MERDSPAQPSDWLRSRFAPDLPTHTRRAALRLLDEHSRGLIPLRAALSLVDDDHDPTLRARARVLVSRWAPPDAAKLCSALPNAERALLSAEIDAAADAIAPGTVRVLLWILKL